MCTSHLARIFALATLHTFLLSAAASADQPAVAFAMGITFGDGGGSIDLDSAPADPVQGTAAGIQSLSLSSAEGARAAAANASAITSGPVQGTVATSGASSDPYLNVMSNVKIDSFGFESEVLVQSALQD